MKRINILIIAVILIYVIFAIGTANIILREDDSSLSEYKVEINRIMSDIEDSIKTNGQNDIHINLDEYTYIKKIRIVDISKDESAWNELIAANNGMEYQIEPLYKDNIQCGYVRFDYQLMRNISGMIIHVEVILAIAFVIIITVLIYLRNNIIRPFARLNNVPYELAKGHLKGEIEENKSRFFGNFLWGIGMLKDKLDSNRKKELKLEKEKKMLLLSISHDIKTPLNSIKLYSKAIEENLYPSEKERIYAAHQIGEKTIEIEKFVAEIVKTSSSDILEIEVNPGEFYIDNLINQVRKNYNSRCEALHLELEIDEYDNKLLKGDFDRTYEVIENILENALKYGDGRSIRISFYEEDYCQLIRIHNSGEPVSQQDYNHLFDSFFRGSNTEGKDGSGLGLYICQQIMHKMNGEIFAEVKEDGMDFVLVMQM